MATRLAGQAETSRKAVRYKAQKASLDGTTTRQLLALADAELKTHWAREALQAGLATRLTLTSSEVGFTHAGLWAGDRPVTGWKAMALHAAFGQPLAARSGDELVAWTIQAYKAIKAQSSRCAEAGCTEEVIHRHLTLAARARAEYADHTPLDGRETWASRDAAMDGTLFRLTGKWLKVEARWLGYYLSQQKAAAEWLRPDRVWNLVKIARRFGTTEKFGRVAYDHIPPTVLLRAAALSRWLVDPVLRKWDKTTREGGSFDRVAFWAEVHARQRAGKTAGLKTSSLSVQVAELAPNREIYKTLKDRPLRGDRSFKFLRELKWAQYHRMLPVVQEHNSDLAVGLTLRLVATFGNEAERWLGRDNSHDLTEWLPLEVPSDLKGLSAVLFKYGQGYSRLPYQRQQQLRIIAASWARMSQADRQLPSLEQLVRAAQAAQYFGITEDTKPLALECARWGVSQDDFNDWSTRWVASLGTPSPFAALMGREWTSEGLRGRFLPRSDARGLFLGQHTNCCQHPTGAGATCAWHGQESPHGGFFVWENDRGIQAQAWVWQTRDGDTCFDNIEALSGDATLRARVLAVLNSVARDLGGRVTLGTGYDESHGFSTAYPRLDRMDPVEGGYRPQILVPADYSGYRDSTDQVLVFDGPRKAVEPATRVYTRMAGEPDQGRLEAIAREVYPEQMQFVSYEEGNLVPVLVRDGQVEGYAILDLQGRHVNDIAVLPGARRHLRVLLDEVLIHIRRVGGVWTAECREATSLPMLKGMAKRGLLTILNQEDQGSWGADQMVAVSLTAR